MSVSGNGSACATDGWLSPAERVVMRMRRAAAAGLVLLLAACGSTGMRSQGSQSQGAQNPPPVFNLSGYSAQYKKGHADGCAQRRDDRLYRDEADYMMGVNDGRNACAKLRR